MHKEKSAELLSPAGTLKALRYAFAYGADAVLPWIEYVIAVAMMSTRHRAQVTWSVFPDRKNRLWPVTAATSC